MNESPAHRPIYKEVAPVVVVFTEGQVEDEIRDKYLHLLRQHLDFSLDLVFYETPENTVKLHGIVKSLQDQDSRDKLFDISPEVIVKKLIEIRDDLFQMPVTSYGAQDSFATE